MEHVQNNIFGFTFEHLKYLTRISAKGKLE